MASVTYSNVYKRFGDFTAVNDLSIEVADKEFRLAGKAHGCLDGAVAATDAEDLRTPIFFRVSDLVHDLGQFFAGDPQLAWRSAATQSEQHVAGVIGVRGGTNREAMISAVDGQNPELMHAA